MALLTAAQARGLILVDPATATKIEHVKACDVDKCYYETWTVIPCAPGYETVVQRPDGTCEMREWTPVKLTNFCGESEYMWCPRWGDFDLVDKVTGEVVAEARLGSKDSEVVPEENGSDLEPFIGEEHEKLAPNLHALQEMDRLLDD